MAEALQRTAWWAAGAVTAGFLAWLAWRCGFGYEFTDEGYYLASIADPGAVPRTASQFGFVYHPLYVALGGDIAWLRRINLALTYALALALFLALLPREGWMALARRVSAAMLATSSLAVFAAWLPTPSYNGLALQGLLLSALVVARLRANAEGLAWWCVLGIAGALVFLAKPTCAAMLAVLATVLLGSLGAWRWRGAGVAGLTALGALLAAALAIDGSPGVFAQRIAGGAQIMQILDPRYGFLSLWRIDDFEFSAVEWRLFCTLAIALALIIGSAQRSGLLARLLPPVSALLLVDAALLAAEGIDTFLPQAPFVGTQALALLIGTAAGVPAGGARVPREAMAAAAAAATLPWVFAFGSNNNYWAAGANAAVFWVVAAVLLLATAGPQRRARLFALLGAATLAWMANLWALGVSHPYRLEGPLAAHSVRVAIGEREASLHVTPAARDYLLALRSGGLPAGTPVIDFSGQSPGALHALDARTIGLAWWAGGYPGSEALARDTLARLDCAQLARAWLLLEPDGPRSLPPELAAGFGADVARDYAVAATAFTPPLAGGYAEPRRQSLVRPLRDAGAAEQACLAARAGERP